MMLSAKWSNWATRTKWTGWRFTWASMSYNINWNQNNRVKPSNWKHISNYFFSRFFNQETNVYIKFNYISGGYLLESRDVSWERSILKFLRNKCIYAQYLLALSHLSSEEASSIIFWRNGIANVVSAPFIIPDNALAAASRTWKRKGT